MVITTIQLEKLLEGETADGLAETFPAILQSKRWFGGKARQIAETKVVDQIPFDCDESKVILLFLLVTYMDGGREIYQIPLAAAFGEEAERIRRTYPQAVLMPVAGTDSRTAHTGCLYDATWSDTFPLVLLKAIEQAASFPGKHGTVAGSSTYALHNLVCHEIPLDPAVFKGEQSNTSVSFGGQVILKLYRRLEEGMNPDLEIGRVLTNMRFPYIPPIAGALEYRCDAGEPVTLAVLQQFVCHDGDAWQHSLDAVARFMMRIVQGVHRDEAPPQTVLSLLDLTRNEYHPTARELIGLYLESAERMGQRTAELHVALSQVPGNPAFAPEPLNERYRQACHDRMLRSATDTLAMLKQRVSTLSTTAQAKAQRVFDLKPVIEQTYAAFRDLDSPVARIRCHGDYHLGQILCTGPDFMIIDFEGEPARPLAERRMKQPAMVDVAGMMRSFHYAPFAFIKGIDKGLAIASKDLPPQAGPWGQFWSMWVSAAFLKAYLRIASGTCFWPQDETAVRLLFNVYLMEKAVYEIGYELNNRPDWAEIPLSGLKDHLETVGQATD